MKNRTFHKFLFVLFLLLTFFSEVYSNNITQFTNLARQGNEGAQVKLGQIYSSGLGVDVDINTAIEWYKLAANQGNAHAQITLGNIYLNDCKEMFQNGKEAVKWYELAARQGNEGAQVKLGLMYEYGIKVEKNLERAIFWYQKAARNGNSEAITKINNFMKGENAENETIENLYEKVLSLEERIKELEEWR